MICHSLKNIFGSLISAYDFAFCQNNGSLKIFQNVLWKKPFNNANRYQSFVGGFPKQNIETNMGVRWVPIREIFEVPESWDMKNDIFKVDSIIFLYLLRHSGDSWEGYGSRFWQNFESSQNRQKSIGIDQESTFSHFGIIKTPFWH